MALFEVEDDVVAVGEDVAAEDGWTSAGGTAGGVRVIMGRGLRPEPGGAFLGGRSAARHPRSSPGRIATRALVSKAWPAVVGRSRARSPRKWRNTSTVLHARAGPPGSRYNPEPGWKNPRSRVPAQLRAVREPAVGGAPRGARPGQLGRVRPRRGGVPAGRRRGPSVRRQERRPRSASRSPATARNPCPVAYLGAGEVIGELALLTGSPRGRDGALARARRAVHGREGRVPRPDAGAAGVRPQPVPRAGAPAGADHAQGAAAVASSCRATCSTSTWRR